MSGESHNNETSADGDKGLHNARLVYEYLMKAHDDTVAGQARFVDRAHKWMLIQALLFASLSYGVANLTYVAEHRFGSKVVVIAGTVLGAIAGISLAMSFFGAIQCYRRGSTYPPATLKIAESLESGSMSKWDAQKLLQVLGTNVHKAIETARKDEPRRARWQSWVNWTVALGFALTALFVCITAGERLLLDARRPEGVSNIWKSCSKHWRHCHAGYERPRGDARKEGGAAGVR